MRSWPLWSPGCATSSEVKFSYVWAWTQFSLFLLCLSLLVLWRESGCQISCLAHLDQHNSRSLGCLFLGWVSDFHVSDSVPWSRLSINPASETGNSEWRAPSPGHISSGTWPRYRVWAFWGVGNKLSYQWGTTAQSCWDTNSYITIGEGGNDWNQIRLIYFTVLLFIGSSQTNCLGEPITGKESWDHECPVAPA